MNLNTTMISTDSRASVDLDATMLNESINTAVIGAPTIKSISSTIPPPVPTKNIPQLLMPEWVHCEICKRREHNGLNNTRLPLGYCHPCGHIVCRDCAMQAMMVNNSNAPPGNTNSLCAMCAKSTHIYTINGNLPPQIKVLFISRYELVHATEIQVREQVHKLYTNMYKQLFDVFDYQDAKWNQLMTHRIEYLRYMNKIKKGMIELEETKRINKELMKILQEQEQFALQESKHANGPIHDHQQAMRHYRQTMPPATPVRPSSVASSTSLNFGPQQQRHQPSTTTGSLTHSTTMRPMVAASSPIPHHHVPPPEPDKLMTYEQAMIYAHPALKDALRLAHRRKMSSKNSGTSGSK